MDEIRFNHYLPYSDNGYYDIVVNLQLPHANIERIIVNIMSDDANAHQTWENPEGIQLPVIAAPDYILQDTGAMQKTLPPWERIAECDASDDIDEIKDLQESGHFVIFDDKLFDRRIKSLARRVTGRYLGDPAVSLGHEALREAYEKAYLRTFERKIHLIQEKLVEIKDKREKALRAELKDDRLLVYNRDSGDWHARDLVLVRILQIYYPDGLNDIDIVSVLLERHALIDRYASYVLDFEDRNEVTWPDPSFRPAQ